jgi:hypothetical protein
MHAYASRHRHFTRPKEDGKASETERVEVEVPSNLDLDLDFLDMLQIGHLYRVLLQGSFIWLFLRALFRALLVEVEVSGLHIYIRMLLLLL